MTTVQLNGRLELVCQLLGLQYSDYSRADTYHYHHDARTSQIEPFAPWWSCAPSCEHVFDGLGARLGTRLREKSKSGASLQPIRSRGSDSALPDRAD